MAICIEPKHHDAALKQAVTFMFANIYGLRGLEREYDITISNFEMIMHELQKPYEEKPGWVSAEFSTFLSARVAELCKAKTNDEITKICAEGRLKIQNEISDLPHQLKAKSFMNTYLAVINHQIGVRQY